MEQKIDPYPAGFYGSTHHTAWQLIKAYWQSEQRFPAYIFFSIILSLTVSLASIDLVFNYWYYYFYDVLQAYDKHGAMRLLLVFCMLSAFYLLFEGYRYLVTQLFGQRWRRWLTTKLMGRWLKKSSAAYGKNYTMRMFLADRQMQDDVNALINYSIDLSMGLIGVITAFFVMVYVLWQISGDVNLSLGLLGTIKLPGYLVWVGVLYAFLGTFVIFKTGRPLLVPTPNPTKMGFAPTESALLKPLKLIMKCSTGCYQLSIILPLLVVLPNSFDQVFLLSWLLHCIQVFNRGQGALSFIVRSNVLAQRTRVASAVRRLGACSSSSRRNFPAPRVA